MSKRRPFSKVSDLQKWLGLSENGLKLYEKNGIIDPERNKRNRYRKLNISDGDKMFQNRIYTGYGFTVKQAADLLQTADYNKQYDELAGQEKQLQEEADMALLKLKHLKAHRHLLFQLKTKISQVEFVEPPELVFLPVHDQAQTKAPGESDCASWLRNVPFVYSSIMMSLGNDSEICFGPSAEISIARRFELPMEHAVIAGKESSRYVMGFACHGLEDSLTEKEYGHLISYAKERGYSCFGTVFARHLLLEKQDDLWIHYDQIWIPIKKPIKKDKGGIL